MSSSTWPEYIRESLPVQSSSHQTLIGKSLFEYGDCPTVAAIAASSSSFRNSSLGPNLLALIPIESPQIWNLFTKVFNNNSNNGSSTSTLQFTRKLNLVLNQTDQVQQQENGEMYHPIVPFFSSLVHSKYFGRSLLRLEIDVQSISHDNDGCSLFSSAFDNDDGENNNNLLLLSTVESLRLSNSCSNINETFLPYISSKFLQLSYLDLQSCTGMKDIGFQKLAASPLPSLKSLDLSRCFRIADKSLECIGSKFVNLENLCLSSCSGISDEGILHLQPLQSLKFLTLEHCNKITDVSLKYISAHHPDMTNLILTGCTKITDAGLHHLANTPYEGTWSLNYLTLNLCHQITDSGVIEIANNKSLPNLEYLFLNECVNVSNHAIQSIVVNLPKLIGLGVVGCPNMDDETLEFLWSKDGKLMKHLLSLHIGRCDNVTTEGVKKFVKSMNRCMYLSTGGCKKVSQKVIAELEEEYPDMIFGN